MRRLERVLRGSRGTTLVELVVTIGIIVPFMSVVVVSMFLGMKSEQGVREDGLALNELRKALGWFASDVQMSKTSDLVDGAPAVAGVTLTWTDQYQGGDVDHSSSYSVLNGELVRTYDGRSIAVARRVVSASFSRSGTRVTAQIQVHAKDSTTRTLTSSAVMRPTQ